MQKSARTIKLVTLKLLIVYLVMPRFSGKSTIRPVKQTVVITLPGKNWAGTLGGHTMISVVIVW